MPRISLSEEEGAAALSAAGTDIKYLFERHDVAVENQKIFYHTGVTTLEKLSNFAKDKEDLISVLKEHWGLDQERFLDERVQDKFKNKCFISVAADGSQEGVSAAKSMAVIYPNGSSTAERSAALPGLVAIPPPASMDEKTQKGQKRSREEKPPPEPRAFEPYEMVRGCVIAWAPFCLRKQTATVLRNHFISAKHREPFVIVR
eukprot:g29623.t1